MIRFGTDGWRGIIAKDFTFDNVRICAQGVANYLKKKNLAQKGIIVGYDTRFASEEFAIASAEVLSANNIKVFLTSKPLPTPVISFSVRLKQTGGAVIITASHNPYLWNGFKVKSKEGCPVPPEIEREIEEEIAGVKSPPSLPLPSALSQGIIEYLDPTPEYLQHLSTLVDLEGIKSSPLRIIIDPMYGAGAGFLPALLSGGRIWFREIHNVRNPLFPGLKPEPIASNLKELASAVKGEGAVVGLALDGDADRFGVVDEKGEFITPLQVFPLLSLYLLKIRGEKGAIVKTVSTTRMLFKIGELFDVPVYETPVGFKYVASIMLEKDALIGGEESGGYGFRRHIPERDGILSSLLFLDLMVKMGKNPSQLLEYLYNLVGPHFYSRLDFTLPEGKKETIYQRVKSALPSKLCGLPVIQRDTLDGFRFILSDGSWLLIRFSGTEPLLRLYAESPSQKQTYQILEEGKGLIGI